MTNELPDPLTPADCDLQDFAFMPLDVDRLRDSDLASDETPEACWAAVLLWCASWHQVPAASIPDNENWIAKQAGYAQRGKIDKDWQHVRDGALRGWIKCSDGRFYHPVVAEKACDAWQAKHVQRHKNECGRIKKHNQRHGTAFPYPTLEQFLSPNYRDPVLGDKPPESPGTNGDSPGNVPGETASKRQGEGQGQGDRDRQGELKEQDMPSGSDGDGSPDDPSGDDRLPSHPQGSTPPNDAAVRIATSLRAWERQRGKFATTTSANCADLVRLAPTDTELREAYDLAVADREEAKDEKPVNPGFIAIFLAKLRTPQRPKKPASPPWWLTDAAMNAKGAEFGLNARPGESRDDFRSRINAAIDAAGAAAA